MTVDIGALHEELAARIVAARSNPAGNDFSCAARTSRSPSRVG